MPRDNAEFSWCDSSSPKLQSSTCQHCQNNKENNAGLVVGKKQHKHKNEKFKADAYRCNKRPGKNEMYTYGLVGIAKNTKKIVIRGWLLLGRKHTNQHGKNTKNVK